MENFADFTIYLLTSVSVAAIAGVIYLIKTVRRHNTEIADIKRRFVTKQELTTVRDELTASIKALTCDIKEIKDTSLTKSDFYRVQSQTEKKIDKIYDLLLKGGFGGNE